MQTIQTFGVCYVKIKDFDCILETPKIKDFGGRF